MSYTDEQYAAAAEFIRNNIDRPEYIAQVASDLGIPLSEITTAVQKAGYDVSQSEVGQFFANNDVNVAEYFPETVTPTPTPTAPAAVPAARTFSPQQYIDVGQWLKSNINTPDFYKVVNQLAAQEGVSRGDLLKAAQTVAPGLTAGDIDKFLSGNYRPTPAGEYKSTVTGGKGVDFMGSTGLREAYGPYVTDYLSRMSGLLALRDSPDYKPIKFGTEATGGTYGGETAQTLADLQAKREAMMSGNEAYKPYQYSFAQKPMTTQPAAKGGIMSLVDHYDVGGTVGNVADTVVGGANTGTPTYANQTVPSTYTAPTNTYTGPGDSGITTGSFDQNAISRFTNPYTTAVTDPQVREAKRQAQLASQAQAAKFSQAGAFGGSRSILAENELGRNLATQIGDIYGKGQKEAYDAALRAFEAEEGRKLTAGVETERARQEAGRQGLTGAANEAQYQQQARELQQRAEEAAARGDQFEASLALQQLQEANRAAESTRGFEYQQARDTYLDPFREILYANQALSGLPIQAGASGISPSANALKALLATSGVLFPDNTGG